ncbi:unnamed protein product [Protopolystoma xenopodis]|uniref:Uncharacterized protein n=1 Tax=Protopolystoma xenopodis TaxID=117903 RepID=A0A448WTP7_9PLAT|nr:unnamed protein product [Protopolystoma xenopodis]
MYPLGEIDCPATPPPPTPLLPCPAWQQCRPVVDALLRYVCSTSTQHVNDQFRVTLPTPCSLSNSPKGSLSHLETGSPANPLLLNTRTRPQNAANNRFRAHVCAEA